MPPAALFELVAAAEMLRAAFYQSLEGRLDDAGLKVNGAQAMILFRLGEESLPFMEFGRRRIYIGSNSSYHLRMMTKSGLLASADDATDGRRTIYWATDRGRAIGRQVGKIVAGWEGVISRVGGIQLPAAVKAVRALEHAIDGIIG